MSLTRDEWRQFFERTHRFEQRLDRNDLPTSRRALKAELRAFVWFVKNQIEWGASGQMEPHCERHRQYPEVVVTKGPRLVVSKPNDPTES